MTMPTSQIVSRVWGSPQSGQAWLEEDGDGGLSVRCTRCNLHEPADDEARGLLRLGPHALGCGLGAPVNP